MKWANHMALWALLVVPAVVYLFARASRKRTRSLEILGDRELLSRMSPSLNAGRRKIKAALIITALLLLSVALARPQVGVGLKEIHVTGRDIVFVLDVSNSMLAQDIAPSRIQAAKAEIAGLLDTMKGDRVGLVIFAGDAFLQCPLTADDTAMRMLLDTVKVGSVPKPGTNIADAMALALKAFSMAQSTSKVVVLLTDGEDHSGKALDEAKEASKENVQIYTVGMGRAGSGAPIPIQQDGGGVAYKQDAEGKTVMSALDEETLQKVALETGGKYYYAGERLDLKKVYDQIAKKQGSSTQDDRFYTHYEDRYQWLLIPALLLLFVEALLSERRKIIGKFKSPAGLALILFILPLLMAFGGPVTENVRAGNELFKLGKFGEAIANYTDAQVFAPEDPRLHYNIGDALYKQGKYPEARASFQKAMTANDIDLKERAYYNTGNCFFREGVAAGDIKILGQAVESYEKALELNPNDQDAKYNLEVVRRMIEMKKKEQPPQQQQQQQNQQENQQQNQQQNQEQNQQQSQQQNQPQTQESQSATQEQQMQPMKAATAEQQAQQQGGQPKEMGREEAMQLLRALEDKERQNLEEQNPPTQSSPGRVLKDW